MLKWSKPEAGNYTVWHYLGLLCGLCIVGLLSVLVGRQQTIMKQMQRHEQISATKFQTTYSRDRRYMTLDHEYDFLWAEWNDGAQIVVPDETTGVTIPAAISM